MENVIFCQSCMMPMQGEEYGTEKDGSRSTDYCHYCYKDGGFTDESTTMEQMVEFCIPHVIEAGVFKTANEARADMLLSYPKLKRWAV
ncbi:MAG: zinc ribbon domain-containing protein [Oscillospiraceae bacterium]|jgi:hypothetical protein|nr:zinc ribbon domain-containing protein [Oscillospiraceae bacterium]